MDEKNRDRPLDPAQRFEAFIRRLEEARRRLAFDTLTGLFSWSAGESFLEQRLQRTEPLSVALIKIIQLKAVNQAHGYKAGDDFLRRMAIIVSGISVPDRDFPCRWSGNSIILASPERLDGLDLAYRIGYSQPWTESSTPDISVKVAHAVPGDTVESLLVRTQS